MRWLLFLSRVAFICNVFFLLALSLQLFQWLGSEDAQSTVIILGLVMAAIFNPVTNFFYGLFLLSDKKKVLNVPRWLVSANLLFLFLQIFYIVFRNGY